LIKEGAGFCAGVLGVLGPENDTALVGAMGGLIGKGLDRGGSLGVGYGVEVGSKLGSWYLRVTSDCCWFCCGGWVPWDVSTNLFEVEWMWPWRFELNQFTSNLII
jgi:hypothetical protein